MFTKPMPPSTTNSSGTSSLDPGGGGGIFCYFLHRMVGHLSLFARYLNLSIPEVGGKGGVGIYFDWCIILLQQVKLIGRVSYTFILPVSLSSFYNNSYMFEAKF